MKLFTLLILALSMIIPFSMNAQAIDKNNQQKDTTSTNSDDMDSFTLMKTGEKVPDFNLTTIDGKKIQLSELKGKTLFLNYFTLSCPMCMKELPLIEKGIWQKYKDNPNIVILIVGREETAEKLMVFRDKKKFTFPIASDPKREVYSLFASKYVPRNIVIDKNGILVLTEVGFKEENADELFQKIENELEK